MKFGLGLGINQRAENLEGMGGFDISNVSGLQRWYKFQTGITLNGSNVSKWDDQSGNNVHLTQSTATQQPSYNSGNLGFDRVNDKMSMDSNIALTTFTIFMVISTDTTSSNNQTLFSGAVSNGQDFFRYDLTLWRFRPSSGAASQQTISHSLTNTEKFLLTVVGSDDSGTLNFAIRDNGTAVGNATCNSTTGSDTFNLQVIGDHNNTNQLWDGKISEIVVFNTALTGTDLDNVESDLMTRHGL